MMMSPRERRRADAERKARYTMVAAIWVIAIAWAVTVLVLQ